MPSEPSSITQMLTEWRHGDQEAGNRLLAMTYQELRHLDGWHLQKERQDNTIQGDGAGEQVLF